jgi:Cu/Ag efflux protein CusF
MKRFGLLLAIVAIITFAACASAFAAEEGKAGGGRGGVFGEITKIADKVLTITQKKQDGTTSEQNVTFEESTEVFSQAAAKLEDLKVGQRVTIAKEGKQSRGEITKIDIDGKSVTLKNRRGDEETVVVDANTKITASVKGKFEDLKVGQRVSVFMRDGKAARIEIRPAGERPASK